MPETKRVNDQYNIEAPAVVIAGNLTVTGTTTTISTVNSTVKDAVITLNQGQTGAGITNGFAGIEIDRGTSDDARLVYSEPNLAWEARLGTTLTQLKAAAPIDPEDVVTKGYFTASGSVAGANTQVQFNNNGVFGASTNFTFNGTVLNVLSTQIGSASIATTATNGNFQIAANGTGKIVLKSAMQLENRASDPVAVAGNNMLYAKTPGNAGTGLYFANSNDSGELVSKSKALLFGLIF